MLTFAAHQYPSPSKLPFKSSTNYIHSLVGRPLPSSLRLKRSTMAPSTEGHEDISHASIKLAPASKSSSNSPSPPKPATTSTPIAANIERPLTSLAQPFWLTWKSWESVAVTLRNIPRDANTYVLWRAFSKEGNITAIDIFDDRHGNRASRGRIRFRSVSSAPLLSNDFTLAILPAVGCWYLH